MKLDIAKIRLIMAEDALTATAISEKCGVSRQNVSNILTRGTCTPITAGKLARSLGVPVKDIILEEV